MLIIQNIYTPPLNSFHFIIYTFNLLHIRVLFFSSQIFSQVIINRGYWCKIILIISCRYVSLAYSHFFISQFQLFIRNHSHSRTHISLHSHCLIVCSSVIVPIGNRRYDSLVRRPGSQWRQWWNLNIKSCIIAKLFTTKHGGYIFTSNIVLCISQNWIHFIWQHANHHNYK